MADDLKPAYLLTGSDTPKIDRALRRLRGHFDPSAYEQLDGLSVTGNDIVAACNSMGLFGGDARLVVVTEVDGRPNKEGRLVGGLKAADFEEIATYLAAPAPGTLLALVGREVKADSAIAKAVKNWTYKDKFGRIDILVGIAYDADPVRARELLLACRVLIDTRLERLDPEADGAETSSRLQHIDIDFDT